MYYRTYKNKLPLDFNIDLEDCKILMYVSFKNQSLAFCLYKINSIRVYSSNYSILGDKINYVLNNLVPGSDMCRTWTEVYTLALTVLTPGKKYEVYL